MGFSDVTNRRAVEQAITEYNNDPEAFLTGYGFATATSYALVYQGREYPPKAILGVAHKYQFPSLGPLKNTEFSGGEGSTNRVLTNMNFSVIDVSQKIQLLKSIRSIKVGSIPGFGKAPHKPLLLLLALKYASVSSLRLRPIADWSTELQILLGEFAPGIETETLEPLWRLENNLWSVTAGGVEVRPNPPGDPDQKAFRGSNVIAGLTESAFATLQDTRTRSEVRDVLLNDFLSEITEDQRMRLSAMISVPKFWWVNQGKTYKEERDSGIVWAPLLQKNKIPAGHHVALAEMKTGDFVVHYSKGAIRSIGMVTTEATEKQNPFERVDNEWEALGREVGVEYFELSNPILLGEIENIPVGDGPFDKNGGIKQGYMFPLSETWSRDLQNQFLDRWPESSVWGKRSHQLAMGDSLAHLAKWLIEFRQVDDFEKEEIEYKLEIFERINHCLNDNVTNLETWLESLRLALTTKNNLVDFRTLRGFLEQVKEMPVEAKEMITFLSNEDEQLNDRIRQFSVWDKKNSGSGVKLSLISLLVASVDPLNNPVFNATPVSTIMTLIGRRSSQGEASVRYAEFVQLIDDLMQICTRMAESDLVSISNRLEMQSAMWMISKRKPHPSWDSVKQREYLTFIGGEHVSHHLDNLAEEVLLDVSFLSEIEELLEDKKQVIFYGPPGVGKTYLALKIAEALSQSNGEKDHVELVQFHPSYAYEDFIEGIRPTDSGNFVLKPGKLLSIARRAADNQDSKFFLIIDEINRGNVAKIFGEMLFLLEYRDHEIKLQYSDESFKVPKNLYFIGTMNSADRSIGLIDSALRRRFHFVSFYPTETEMKDLLRNWLLQNAPDVAWVADVVDYVNRSIEKNFAIGPSHFMKPNLDEALVKKIWKRSILPYLEDIFFNQESKVKEFELERLRTLKRLNQDRNSSGDVELEDDSAAS